jgi:hypothetical protein
VRSPRRWLAALTGMAAIALTAGSAMASAAPAPATPTDHPVTHVCDQHPKPGFAACFALRRTDVTASPNTPSLPSGYGPSDLRSAYNLTAGGSASATVAIVDSNDDPNAESDLATYRSTYGLPACTTANGCFKKVNENGQASPLPTADSGWAGEISLDVDMVSAICPNCHILLVEANQPSMSDLGTAVNTAVSLGAKYVSNSYGGSEDGTENSSDSSYFNHPGVAITASTGDSGYGISYPSSSAYVTAVGGTSLSRASNSRGWTESAWSGAGSGCSSDVAKPSFQGSVTTGCANRADADVSAVADPNTGLAVYQTYGGSGWAVYGGTSASSPIIASVYALAGTPGSSDRPASYPYANTGSLYDVTSGSNGSCSPSVQCKAGTGWDGPTGLGTPNGTSAFTAGGTPPPPGSPSVTNPGSQSGTVGTATSLQLSATGGTSPYTWSATGLPAGLSISSSGLISGTPSTAGTSSVTATVTDAAGKTGSATFSWTINPQGGGGCSGQKLGNAGFESGTAPWTTTAGVINANGAGETSHSGTYYAWLDGYGTTHTDSATQSAAIPAGCHATLSFWLHIDTAETTKTTQFDKLTVKVGSTTVATFSNLNAASGYVQHSYDVSSLAGQTVTVSFSGTEDSSLQTSFVLDDTALTLS